MLELMNAHQLAAFGEADYTADDLRTWLTTPYVEIDRDLRVLERDGRLIGYVDADPTRDDPPLWWCDVKVDPDVDAGEVVAELVAWLEERAAEGRLRVWTSEDDVRIVSAFGALGFEQVRHSYRMEIDLDDELAPSPPGRRESPCARPRPTTTGCSSMPSSRSGRTRTTRSTRPSRSGRTGMSSATRTIPRSGFSPSPATSWRASRSAGPIRSTRTPATSACSASGGRGGGKGSARRSCSTRSQRSAQRGLTRGTLGVDASSVTGATRLYERAGMRVYRDTVFLERAVRE